MLAPGAQSREGRELAEFQPSGKTLAQLGRADHAHAPHLALWWKEFVESSHNRLARELAAADQVNLWEATRLFALLNMSVMEAYIGVFDNSFY